MVNQPEKEAIIPVYATSGELIALAHRSMQRENKHWIFYKAVEMGEDDIVSLLKGKLSEPLAST